MKKFLFLSVFLLFFLLPSPTYAQDYYFPNVTYEYTIQPTGAINVVEQRTYHFDGSFSWATEYIPLEGERQGVHKMYPFRVTISQYQVFLDGQELPAETEETEIEGEKSFSTR